MLRSEEVSGKFMHTISNEKQNGEKWNDIQHIGSEIKCICLKSKWEKKFSNSWKS